MFFYETFGTRGVPSALPRVLVRAFPDEIGAGFARYGLYADPSSHDGLPFGMAKGRHLGVATALAFTCASCHLARLPDGRFAVGAPNHRYDYGGHILAMTVFPFLATAGPSGHDEAAIARVQPLLDRLRADPRLWKALGGALMLAVGAFKAPSLGPERERAYASWPTGTQDFLMKPVFVDDGVEIVSKIPPLYDLPRDETLRAHGMAHALYGTSGNARSLVSFMHGFIALGGGDPRKWPASRLRPLIEYLHSLEAPRNPHPAAPAAIAAGRALFADKGCATCHDGPAHGGRRVYRFDEIGTDDTLARWLDPEHAGTPCCGAQLADPLTRAVTAPRLVLLWAQTRFLHNGALSSLEQLFCLAPRPTQAPPMSTAGHRQTCDGLDVDEKRALIAYLESL